MGANIPLEFIDKIRNLSDAEYRNLHTILGGSGTSTAHTCVCENGEAHSIVVKNPAE